MVNTSTSNPRMSRRWWRGLLLVVMVLAAVLGPAAVASAQQEDNTYGFNEACDDLHDALDGLGIPGTPLNMGNAAAAVCKAGNVATHPGEAAEAVANKAWDSTFGEVVDSILQGLGEALTMALTFWTKVPNSAAEDLPGLTTKVRDYTNDIQIYLLAASLVICGVRLAQARAHAAAEEATETFRVLFRTVVASTMWATLLVIGTRASDAFAEWVIDDATGGNARGIAEAMIQTQALTFFSPGLVLIFAVVGLLSALLQILLALIRQGLLVVVAGVLPLAAAASGTQAGKQFHHKLLLWSVAFVLYKPIAALAYMIAFTVAGNNNRIVTGDAPPDADTAVKVLVGVTLLCSVAFVLPALMRLLSPVAAMGSGVSGAAVAGGMVGGAASMAMFGKAATGAADSRGGGTMTASHTSTNRPSGTGSSGRGAAAGAGAKGSAGASGAGSAGAAGKSAGASGSAAAGAKAGGPYGAAAAAAGSAVGTGLRAADNGVNQAAASGDTSSAPARPSGTGFKAVPR